jgi:hypothetical protein
LASVDAHSGTRVSAAACAAARSPCESGVHRPVTPIGAMKSGEASGVPNRSAERSRCALSTIIRGTMPQCAKALALRRCVSSSPQPPWT